MLHTFTVHCSFGLLSYVYACMKYLQKNTSKRLFIYTVVSGKLLRRKVKKNLTASFKAQSIVATVLKTAGHVTLRIFLVIIIYYYYYKEILLLMFVLLQSIRKELVIMFMVKDSRNCSICYTSCADVNKLLFCVPD